MPASDLLYETDFNKTLLTQHIIYTYSLSWESKSFSAFLGSIIAILSHCFPANIAKFLRAPFFYTTRLVAGSILREFPLRNLP